MTEFEYSLNDLLNGDKAGNKARRIIKVVDKKNQNEQEMEKELEKKALVGSRSIDQSLIILLGGLI